MNNRISFFPIFFTGIHYIDLSTGKVMHKPTVPHIYLGKKYKWGKGTYEILYLNVKTLILTLLWIVSWTIYLILEDRNVVITSISTVFAFYPLMTNVLDWFFYWKKIKKSFND